MKRLYIVMLLWLAQLCIYAQYQIKVLDKETKEPVAHANVFFPDIKTGTTTDESGVFNINTKVNSVLVQIFSLNYKTYLGTIKLQNQILSVFLEPSSHDLQEITVSGNGSKLQGENVINVEVIKLNNNPELQGISLSQRLSSIPGISNLSTGMGIGKPVIRGFSGNRIAVFSQGIRLENQQWGDEHGLGLDEIGYEQVEIIKGPASLLYGSDALGGVIYFVDERYADHNTLSFVINSEYNSNTAGWRNTGGLKLSKERWHWNLFGGYTTHKDYEDGNNDIVENNRFNTTSAKTSIGYTGGMFTSSLRYGYLNEKYGLLSDDSEDDDYHNGRKPMLPYQHLTTHLLSSENVFFFNDNSKLKVDVGYILNNRKEFEDEHNHVHYDDCDEVALDMNLSTLSYNAKWFSSETKNRWSWITGSQGMYQHNNNKGEEVLIPNATTVDFGIYSTADYRYTDRSYCQIGMRIDGRFIDGEKHGEWNDEDYISAFSNSYTAFNLSTGIFQQLPKNFSLRAALSSGFRAPNMFELLSNGIHMGTNRYELGNPNLKTENCYQLDASFDYQTEHLSFYVSPFFNYIMNYIYLKPSGEEKEDLPVYYYNQTDAYLFGGEAGIHFHPHPLDWLHLEASYSNAYGLDINRNDLPLMPSSKIKSTIAANFTFNKIIDKFSVYTQYQYSFRKNRVAQYEIPTASYSLVNAGIDLSFRVKQQTLFFNAAVNNLFNVTYYDHLSRYKNEGIFNIGRNVVLKLSIPINVKI